MGAVSSISIEVPFPPSANTLFPTDRYGKRRLSVKGRKYRKSVWDAIRAQHGMIKPMTGRLMITTHLWPPDRRRRDEDNLHKCLRDSLTWSKLIDDDSQFFESHNYLHDPVKGGRCLVTLEKLPAGGVNVSQ